MPRKRRRKAVSVITVNGYTVLVCQDWSVHRWKDVQGEWEESKVTDRPECDCTVAFRNNTHGSSLSAIGTDGNTYRFIQERWRIFPRVSFQEA